MTDKRKTFVEEYIVDFNATQAAIRAGYSPRSAGKQGSRLLNDKSVRAKIDARLAEIAKRCGSSRERILRELGRIAFFNPGGENIVNSMLDGTASPDDTAVISYMKIKSYPGKDGDTVESEVRFADKLKALELLGRHYAMFQDNVNVSGDVGVQIIDDIPGKTD